MTISPAPISSNYSLNSDPAGIERYFAAVYEDAPDGALLEIRGIAENKKPLAALFAATVKGRKQACNRAVDWNLHEYNVYCGLHLRRSGTKTDCAATASDVVVDLRWVVVDVDRAPRDGEAPEKLSVPPRFIVETGHIPHLRMQMYWRLDKPISHSAWSDLQRKIAAHLDADPSLVDAPRIVRLPGTVTWPNAQKRARGYVPELTRARRCAGAPREVPASALHEMCGGVAADQPHDALEEADWTHEVDTHRDIPTPSRRRVESALAYVPPDERDIWLRIGGALKSWSIDSGEDIEDLFIRWSRGDMRRDGARIPSGFKGEDDCRRLLATLRRDEAAS